MGGGEENDSGDETRPVEDYLDAASEFRHSDPNLKYREMEQMNCVQSSLRKVEGPAIVMNATEDGSERGTSVFHGAKRKASPVSSIVKLMDICSDRQNGSLVDKVVLPHQEIKKFCDSIAARR